jgi:hypothetical protein
VRLLPTPVINIVKCFLWRQTWPNRGINFTSDVVVTSVGPKADDEPNNHPDDERDNHPVWIPPPKTNGLNFSQFIRD